MLPSPTEPLPEPAKLSTLDGAVFGVVVGAKIPSSGWLSSRLCWRPEMCNSECGLGNASAWKSMTLLSPLSLTGFLWRVKDGTVTEVIDNDDKGREEVRLSRNRKRPYASRWSSSCDCEYGRWCDLDLDFGWDCNRWRDCDLVFIPGCNLFSCGIVDAEFDVMDVSVATVVILDFVRGGSGCGDRGRGRVKENVWEGWIRAGSAVIELLAVGLCEFRDNSS